jgi:integrase
VSRNFRALSAAAGVPVIRFHDLRHTSASLALVGGVPMRVVSDRLGHSSIAITSDLYTKVYDEVAKDAAERIAKMLRASTS